MSDSTTRWALDRFSGTEGTCTYAYGDVTEADHTFRVFVSRSPLETSANIPDSQVYLARGICHLVVERLPDAALPELLESLKTMFEFYGQMRPHVEVLPGPRRVVSGKITGRQERRPLSIDIE